MASKQYNLACIRDINRVLQFNEKNIAIYCHLDNHDLSNCFMWGTDNGLIIGISQYWPLFLVSVSVISENVNDTVINW